VCCKLKELKPETSATTKERKREQEMATSQLTPMVDHKHNNGDEAT
jgi:hypothetical protein